MLFTGVCWPLTELFKSFLPDQISLLDSVVVGADVGCGDSENDKK